MRVRYTLLAEVLVQGCGSQLRRADSDMRLSDICLSHIRLSTPHSPSKLCLSTGRLLQAGWQSRTRFDAFAMSSVPEKLDFRKLQTPCQRPNLPCARPGRNELSARLQLDTGHCEDGKRANQHFGASRRLSHTRPQLFVTPRPGVGCPGLQILC